MREGCGGLRLCDGMVWVTHRLSSSLESLLWVLGCSVGPALGTTRNKERELFGHLLAFFFKKRY